MRMIRKVNPTILLNEAFPYGMTTGGIFVLLTNPPWAEQNITPSLLDMDYFGNHSGEKPISPLVHKLLDSDDTVGLEARTQLAALVMAKFYQPWQKLYDTYYVNYDPLVNYDMDESGSETTDSDKAHADTTSYGKTVNDSESGNSTDTTTYGGTLADNESGNSTNNKSRYGFNSSTAVPTDIETANYQKAFQRATGGTDSVGEQYQKASQETTGGSDSNYGTDNEDKTIEYERHREGINGNINIQKLIKEDRELWIEDYFARVYRDIDSVLTEPIYPSKRRLYNPYWIPSYQNI